jgi:type II secretory pathway pseudopilin PulG
MKSRRTSAFTLVEILIAIGILSMIIASIFSCWTAILRGKRVGMDAAAAVQRSRIVIRTLEDSLASAQCFVLNAQYYGFVAENGQEASLSFVARLAKSFPRGGRFGDFDVRRLTFSVEPGSEGDRQLVLRQNSVFMEMDIDEKEHPLILAKNVKAFQLEFWDAKTSDWTDEWTQTNQIPKLVRVTLRLADNAQSTKSQEVTRIISLPAIAVQPGWQMPMGAPGARPGPPLPTPGGGQGQNGFPSGSRGGNLATP